MPPQDPADPEHPEATGSTSPPPAPPEDVRTRMRRGLLQAMKARDKQAVAALRSTLAAIDNAEAVPAPPGARLGDTDAAGPGPGSVGPVGAGTAEGAGVAGKAPPAGGQRSPTAEGAGSPIAGAVVGLGAAEVERRTLTAQAMEAIVRAEVADREAAARDYERAGRTDHAKAIRAQATLLASYLDPTAGTS